MRRRMTERCSCGGLGRVFMSEGPPMRCGPCTITRQDRALQELGWVPECKSCTAVLTVAEYRGRAEQPPAARAYGTLCADCAESMRDTRRKSA